MNDDELKKIDDETGQYDETYEVAGPPATRDNMSLVLTVLTSLFLCISIILIAIRLYTAYDIGKSPQEIKDRERAVRTGK